MRLYKKLPTMLTLIALILIVIVLFLLINSWPEPQPNRWICNVLLAVALICVLLSFTGVGIHISR